jgi:hypothetical protein
MCSSATLPYRKYQKVLYYLPEISALPLHQYGLHIVEIPNSEVSYGLGAKGAAHHAIMHGNKLSYSSHCACTLIVLHQLDILVMIVFGMETPPTANWQRKTGGSLNDFICRILISLGSPLLSSPEEF